MKLKSIYEHMEAGAEKVPAGKNCKIIFRHSIRGRIDSGVGKDVSLTDEGIELSKFFGRNLDYDIGYVASSTCFRNIQTCENILSGKCIKKEIVKAPDELECPHTKDKVISGKVFEDFKSDGKEIIFRLKNEGLPGFNSLDIAVKIMLDYIFSKGNLENTVASTHYQEMASRC